MQSNSYFGDGTEVALKTDKGTISVLLGPMPSQSSFNIAKGDELSVIGFSAAPQGTPYLIASEVTNGGKTLILQNATRGPGWGGGSGWGGGAPGWGGPRHVLEGVWRAWRMGLPLGLGRQGSLVLSAGGL